MRDLWWAVTGPGLVEEDYCPTVPPVDSRVLRDTFAALDNDPESLHRAVAGHLERERIRLGAYFEDLIRYFVTDIRGHRDVTGGVVISEGKRTIGELDLLFRDGVSCHHWELAVKFYLHVPTLAEDPGECYLGPQTRDRLHLKLARVRDHQLPLAAGEAAVEALGSWQPLRSAALLRGRLFYPASSNWKDAEGGGPVAASHQRGWWCPVDRVEEPLPDADAYALLTRREWFAPIDAAWDRVTPWSRDQVCSWASEAAATWPTGEPVTHVIAGLDSDGLELHRGFVTSVGWPGPTGA